MYILYSAGHFWKINPFIIMHPCLDCQRTFKPNIQIHTKTEICGQLCVFMAFLKQVSQERSFLQQVCCVVYIQCSTSDTWQAAKCRYTCLMDVDRWCVSVSSSTNYFWPIKSLQIRVWNCQHALPCGCHDTQQYVSFWCVNLPLTAVVSCPLSISHVLSWLLFPAYLCPVSGQRVQVCRNIFTQ